MSRRLLLDATCLCLLLAGCSQDPTGYREPAENPPPGGSEAFTIDLAVPSASIAIGSQIVLTATVKGPDGTTRNDTEVVTWSSSDPGVAAVGGQSRGRGTVTAIAVGTTTISASAAGATASVQMLVDSTPGSGAGAVIVSLTAPSASLPVGGQLLLTAVVRRLDGSVRTDVPVVWSTSDPTRATVADQIQGRGMVTGIADGMVRITASAGGSSASVLLTVGAGGGGGGGGGTGGPVTSLVVQPPPGPLAIGQQWALAYIPEDAAGVVLSNVFPAWTSSRPSVVSVSGTGLVTAVSVGEATITASVGSVSASVLVTTTSAGLVLSPRGVQVADGDSLLLTARSVAPFPNGPPGPVQSSVTWTSSNPSAISISAAGWAKALPGSVGEGAIITASSNGNTGELYLSVAPFPAGLAGMVRYIYAGGDAGPLTVHPSKGASAVLSWGDVVEQPIGSGTLQVAFDGLFASDGGRWPVPEFAGNIPPSRTLTLYASSLVSPVYSNYSALIPVWDEPHPVVSPDSVLVRLVMTSWYARSYIGNNIYILPAGAPIDDFPRFCYFDNGAISPFLPLGAGSWDIVIVDPESFVLVPGHPGHEYFRFHVTPQPGRATTYAITGNDSTTMRLITTVEP